MASSAPYKQDLPPKGGYAPINFRRIPARQVLISFVGKKKLLSPGAQCPDHLWRPDRLDGTWPLALQEGDAHMEDMGEHSLEMKTLVHINVIFIIRVAANRVQICNSCPHPPYVGGEGP